MSAFFSNPQESLENVDRQPGGDDFVGRDMKLLHVRKHFSRRTAAKPTKGSTSPKRRTASATTHDDFAGALGIVWPRGQSQTSARHHLPATLQPHCTNIGLRYPNPYRWQDSGSDELIIIASALRGQAPSQLRSATTLRKDQCIQLTVDLSKARRARTWMRISLAIAKNRGAVLRKRDCMIFQSAHITSEIDTTRHHAHPSRPKADEMLAIWRKRQRFARRLTAS